MKPEPLKGKRVPSSDGFRYEYYEKGSVKSAVEGLIKFHEDRIEELIKDIKRYDYQILIDCNIEEINMEYESIMAIELWFEDVIL